MFGKIKTIKIEDKNYPKLLRKIKNPPKILYIRGEISAEENCFAVVGTRAYSIYGKQTAIEISEQLSRAGLTIVSGLAPGIDTFSHISTIEAKGRTIAVLGTGLDEKSIYPKTNIELSRKILETGGTLISEYPPGTRGTRFTFPRRNIIISGLSLGVVVIEAKQKSGALITANWAKKQGRKLFAVPGSIYSPNSKGCHYLIKNGAKLVENADDILKELEKPSINSEILNFNFNRKIKGKNKNETLILETLQGKALDINKIIEITKLPAPIIASNLSILEIEDKIRNIGGNIYTIKKQ